ncbi:hypothetical protein SAMN05444411_10651 [Lutibacter oricola]|uniref:Uncharacterized protein n=1 Tax=Lutibacter oricola TaxID=762486 RepID=A0A1H3C4R4_9FLAO|nr:hypothetical protein [Lutibacter oricola]SDX49030.1 hypothetical protein SAMN05444411_10651 [Lutibacter oricola]
MKNQFLAIFFYFMYLLAMVKPIVPIMEYYANYDYIASVLCENRDKPFLDCNGKCYLQKQLDKNDFKNSHDHNSTIPSISLEDYPVSPVDFFKYTIFNFVEVPTSNYVYVNYASQNVYNSLLKPPQVII